MKGPHSRTPAKAVAQLRRGPTAPTSESGFTLVELMVSLFIFALLAAAGVALLGFSVKAQGAAGERLDEVAALRRLSALMAGDLAQATARISRDSDGRPRAAFVGTTGGGPIALGFVRAGWSNPDGAARASLQRVDWRLEGDRIERRAYPMVDGATPAAWSPVMRGVSALTLRYRLGGEWREVWDPVRPSAVPRAVEATVTVDGVGPVRMLFLSGTGQ